MFKEMRKSQREIFNEDINSILKNGEYGVLATVGENGYPSATPLSYVYLNNAVYFHCAVEGSKLDNIKYNNKVSFNVVGKTKVLAEQFSTEYESVIIFGHAFETAGDEKKDALMAIADKYSPDFKKEGLAYIDRAINKTCVVKIEIDKITGKARR
ncbi:pyridoxamine 5'-phosphate oxidase family protein [Clostridium sp. YIM B02515]|uniref:Pyridoxamine 5'-phosphate oxidase family protein n=1 Tax=Clostridium rhizosphaerae TaxID=2803861 RepID=A0ABS1TFY8_9CLOT|nr:pyridoxamine 5'-phosphate oxidase family protein [Clostridium rhizosphaerae]MBL4938289.1 pyridoxamine 5'-phosphate oxidase family protein [Clostridium rhizosphaerae]